MITRFEVKNYKALRDVALDLTPIHVLIGPNDSGKTSVLEAIAALSSSVDRRLIEGFTGRWDGAELLWRRDPRLKVSSSVSFQVDDERIDYSLEMSFRATGRDVRVGRETIRDSRKGVGWLFDPGRSGHYDTIVAELAQKRADENWAHCAPVHAALSGHQLFRWYPRHLALPVASGDQPRFQLFPSGFGLAQCLDDIVGDGRKRFDDLENRFRGFFPEISAIQLIREPAYFALTDDFGNLSFQRTHGKGLHFKLSNDTSVSASQVSDGVLIVLGYLAVLFSPQPPAFLLVEEPESGIHPKRLGEILKILRELISAHGRTQVVMTTHSPYVLDHFKPEEVTLLRKGEDGAVTAHPLSKSSAVRAQIDVFTLGEIWTAEGEEKLAEQSPPTEASAKR